MFSEALAVHPDQIPETEVMLARKGLRCKFDEYGRPELTDRKHRRDIIKAFGHFDRDGGYGDG